MSEFKLKYQIVADAAKAKAEVKSFDDLLKSSGSSIGSAFAGPAGVAAASIAAMGAAGVTAGVALFNLTKTAADYGSTIFDASKKTGLHAETLSAMDFAAKQSGTSLEAITGATAKFAKTVGEAADGSKEAAATLKEFGITPQDAINDLDGSLDKVFKRIIAARPGIERITLAQKAFGKSGADLLPFLDSFGGDLEALKKKAKELGVSIDDEAAKAADDFGDSLDTLNAQIAGVGRTIGTKLMPVFTEMATDMSSWLAKNQDQVGWWGDAVAVAMNNAYRNTSDLIELIKDNAWWLKYTSVAAFGIAAAAGHFTEQVRRRQEKQKQYQAGAFDFSTLTPAERAALTPKLYGSGDDDAAAGKPNTVTIGRADSQAEFDRQQKAYLAHINEEARAAIENERETMAERVAIRESEYRRMYSVAARYADDEGRTAEQLEKYQEYLAEQLLDHRKTLLLEYIGVLKNAGPEAAGALRDAEHQLMLLEDDIEIQRNDHATNEKKRQAAALEAQKKINAEYNEYLEGLQKKNQRPGLEHRETDEERHARMIRTTVGSGGEISAIGELQNYFTDEGNAAAIAGVDALAQAFGGLGQAIGASVEAWVLYGSVGDNAQEVTAKILASIAQQAAIKSIFELAEGFAMLGLAFFGHPGAGPSATQHFIAAGVYAGIAGGAALAGRAVAGDSLKQGGSGSGRSSSSSSSTGRQQQSVNPYSRQSDDVYISGRRDQPIAALASAVDKLQKKIGSMSAKDVLIAGARQAKGFIGTQAVDDMKTRPQLGSRLLRQTNAR